jgi:hypothetical protein
MSSIWNFIVKWMLIGLFFTAYDLFQVYDGIVQLKIGKALAAGQARLNSMVSDDHSEARASLTEEMTRLRQKQKPIDLLKALQMLNRDRFA